MKLHLACAFAIAICGFWAFQLMTITNPPNFVLMHDVWIKSRTGAFNFKAVVRNPGTGEWSEFVLNGCRDFEPTHEIQPGVTLRMLQYVEDRTNSCMELDGKYAGYTLLRDDHDNPIISPNPGPPATSPYTNSPARPEEARSGTETGRW